MSKDKADRCRGGPRIQNPKSAVALPKVETHIEGLDFGVII